MSDQMPNNQFLSRWMNGELDPKEQQEWENSEGYQQWQKIQQALQNRALSSLDKESAYSATKTSIDNIKRPSTFVRRRVYWTSSIAAAILVALAFFFFSPSTQTWSTPVVEQLNVALPDGSEAILNAGTSLSYSSSPLSNKRILNLDGEAFFDVKTGDPFIVNTTLGTVEVLGTRFNVKGRKEVFEVYCVEGKVAVNHQGQEYLLTAGQGIHPMNQNKPYRHTTQTPSWTQGVSLFQNSPLDQVFDEVERQFDVNIKHADLSNRRYSGRFSHDNLDYTLTIICSAMNLSYNFEDEKHVIIEDK